MKKVKRIYIIIIIIENSTIVVLLLLFYIFERFCFANSREKEFKKKKGGESPFLLAVPQLFILSFYPEKASFLAEKSVAKRHQEREKKGDKEKGGRA